MNEFPNSEGMHKIQKMIGDKVIPEGMSGINIVGGDPLRLGEDTLSRWLKTTEDVEMLRSAALDPRKDKGINDEEWQQWAKNHLASWEQNRRLGDILPEIIANPNCPTDLLTAIADKWISDKDTKEDLETLRISGGMYLPGDPAFDLKTALLNNPKTPGDVLKKMADSKNWLQLSTLIASSALFNPRTEFFKYVYEAYVSKEEGRSSIFLALAKNMKTPVEILLNVCRYFSDPAMIKTKPKGGFYMFKENVLQPILDNPNLPEEGRAMILQQFKTVDEKEEEEYKSGNGK